MKVYNKWSTTNDTKPKGIKNWIDLAPNKNVSCSAIDCDNYAEVGAHVKEAIRHPLNFGETYITGFCRPCNTRNGSFEIDGSMMARI